MDLRCGKCPALLSTITPLFEPLLRLCERFGGAQCLACVSSRLYPATYVLFDDDDSFPDGLWPHRLDVKDELLQSWESPTLLTVSTQASIPTQAISQKTLNKMLALFFPFLLLLLVLCV